MTTALFDRDLLAGDTLDAAHALIGAYLARGDGPNRRIGRIVEVEAYVGREDLASHAHSGRTDRNATMFGPPGRAYVYLTYGMHHCLNVVTEADGRPSALLVRALEPIAGLDVMRRARMDWLDIRFREPSDARLAAGRARVSTLSDRALASGPGLVCQAFSITRVENGRDLCDPASDLQLETDPDEEPLTVLNGPRIGMGTVPEPWHSRPWRFYARGNSSVSHQSGLRRPGSTKS